jgi:quinolinate synthase
VREYLERVPTPVAIGAEERESMRADVISMLKKQDAVLVAHYYTPAIIQDIALETGGCVADSLEMARFCRDHQASTLMVAGVRFMGETAKILSPNKRVLTPTLNAHCSLDIGCPPDAFSAFRALYPDRVVVVYANTSAAVKAQADWVVTSSNACEIVAHLDAQEQKLLWAPDKFLGDYVRRMTGADMVLWNGSCIVHEEFKARGVRDLKALYPEAKMLAHPESPAGVLDEADYIGSTSQIIGFARDVDAQEFIVATDEGLFHHLRRMLPEKRFIIAPTAGKGATCRSCARCPWMAMNDLKQLFTSLRDGGNEVMLEDHLIQRAQIPLERMVNFVPGPAF